MSGTRKRGGLVSPETGERTKRSKPSRDRALRPRSTSLGRSTRLFTPNDIATLASNEVAGLPVLQKADRVAIALGLDHAFCHAVFMLDWHTQPTNIELAESFARVALASHELLRLLGFDESPEELLGLPNAFRTEAPTWDYLYTETGLSHAALFAPPNPPHVTRETACAAIAQAPHVLATLACSANWLRDRLRRGRGPAAKGRRRAIEMDNLFCQLAGVFYATFGCAPAQGSDRTDAGQASLRWIETVLCVANDRASQLILLDLSEEARARRIAKNRFLSFIRAAHDLKAATKADRLAEGWRAWSSLSDSERWPLPIWWPLGIAHGDNTPVPKWLRA